MRARRSRSEWSSIIKAFKKSGGSHEEFCKERGLNLGSFHGWLYRLQKKDKAAPEVALVPVTVTGVTSSPGGGWRSRPRRSSSRWRQIVLMTADRDR
jgi:hypothetical protein